MLMGCANPVAAQQCIDTPAGYVALEAVGYQRESVGTANEDVIETWVAPDGRFVIFYRSVAGVSCIIVMGDNFEEFARGQEG
jgi:hypothetical protein